MYKIEIDNVVTPEEVIAVRGEEITDGNLLQWHKCLQQALCVVSARDADSHLIGIGFLSGNHRHGEIVDMVVHSAVRQKGIGGRIIDTLVSYAKNIGITYLGLTYDQKSPWLKSFYEKHGFRAIDFAMWEKDSVALTNEVTHCKL